MEVLQVKTVRRTQLVDVTDLVRRRVAKAGVSSGVCYVYVPHTTAGVMINEHFDPDVATDLEGVFERLVPRLGPYRHAEGNSDSHAKAVLVGGVAADLRGGRETDARAVAGRFFLRV